jgi:hypothetical protein
MNSTYINGMLQIDHERGVIYFHANGEDSDINLCPTPLRICGLGKIEYPLNDRQVDITIFPKGSTTERQDDKLVRIIK